MDTKNALVAGAESCLKDAGEIAHDMPAGLRTPDPIVIDTSIGIVIPSNAKGCALKKSIHCAKSKTLRDWSLICRPLRTQETA
jgi:hypothetical protein